MIYLCKSCDAYVGVHHGQEKALGRLANRELRQAKKDAHYFFDMIWKGKTMNRTMAYKWLSNQLNLPSEYTHIGMFDLDYCSKVIELSKAYLENSNNNGI